MKIPATQWIAWLGATVAAALTLSAYAFTNFQTKGEAERSGSAIERRLDRIEAKIDELRERRVR